MRTNLCPATKVITRLASRAHLECPFDLCGPSIFGEWVLTISANFRCSYLADGHAHLHTTAAAAAARGGCMSNKQLKLHHILSGSERNSIQQLHSWRAQQQHQQQQLQAQEQSNQEIPCMKFWSDYTLPYLLMLILVKEYGIKKM